LLNCMQELFSEKEKVSLLERCPRFRGVLRARGSPVQLQPSVDVCVYVECRELSQVREDSSQSVQSLSSAILALQGIITKTKGFGIVVTKEQEGLVAKLEDELSHLQSSVAGLQTTN
jgi:hypothetical protein